MKKKILSLLLFAAVALGSFVGCNVPGINTSTSSPAASSSDSTAGEIEKVDYVSDLHLDMNSDSLKLEVTVKTYIDGDTTYFYPKDKSELPNLPELVQREGYIKARYAAVNTPESTGTIEEWGKRASNFTKEKLQSAASGGSIIVETESTKWELDSTNSRFMLWVWYKPAGESEYRNLNLELLQEGLALGSKAGTSRYGKTCLSAIAQANALSLYVYSKEKDPDFYYGSAVELDLKELRTNIDNYVGKRVAFEGTVATYADWTIYVENYDNETQRYYGINVFYGYHHEFHPILATGNRVRIVGNLTYSETYGYQISNLKYDSFEPKNPENIQNLGSGYEAGYQEMTVKEFFSKVDINVETVDPETEEIVVTSKQFDVAQLAFSTSVSIKNLTVKSAYTTNNGGDNDGAISLTCTDNTSNKNITIRIAAIEDANGNMVFNQNDLIGKTIDVRGIVDAYNGEYQVRVFLKDNVIVQ